MRHSWVRWVVLGLAVGGVARRADAAGIPADKLPEPPVAIADSGAVEANNYFRALHAHIHRSWADNFLRLAAEKLPATDQLNDATKSAEVDLVIGGDGKITSVTVARASGLQSFDDAMLEVVRDGAPFPAPPTSVVSDDERLHLRWTFARDQRRCSGVAVIRTFEPVEVVMPKLLSKGWRNEAAKRLAMARGAGLHADPAFTMFAADALKRAMKEPWATVRMVRLLAERGDQDAVNWLKNAVRRPDLAAEAGAALVQVKAPLCPLVKGWFETQAWNDHKTAAAALTTSNDPACVAGLAKLVLNDNAPADARVTAATGLGAIDDPEAKKALADATKDENATVRAAAMLAQIRQGAGRAKVIAMEAFLRDPSPDLRAAAAAGVVRAGGDANLADLYVLFKDDDPRPALAALRELERLPTDESSKLIARLARRPQLPVEKLAAQIIVRRKARDQFAALKPYLDPKTDAELRALALVAADEPALQAASADPKLALAAFRARLARGERDQAADWFIARGVTLSAAEQAAALAEWLAMPEPPPPAPVPPPATASKTASKPGKR